MSEYQEYTVRVYKNKTEYRNKEGQLHRDYDLPAVEYYNGYKSWWQNGLLHRINGPAIEWSSGNKYWYQNDKYHRLDGPAIERKDGTKSWYIERIKYTEKEFHKKIKQMKNSTSCEDKVVVIDGIEYFLRRKV